MIKKPVTGMKDILPGEMAIRDHCISVIRETYEAYGFTPIETPAVESLENLSSKQGGENEKLIFKILKRGEKLKLAEAKTEADVADGGLRYDLTVPLVRYYACHREELPSPFKAVQMGNVYRADRPQKGRYRQFMQCDIDILGEPTNLAETELILATGEALTKLTFRDFEIRIGDRRLLKAMAMSSGFDEDKLDNVFITLDKMDKIGIEGVREELCAEHDEKIVNAYLSLFGAIEGLDNKEALDTIEEKLAEEAKEGSEAKAALDNLREIIQAVEKVKGDSYRMIFDPTLVRGMGYYTGTIFEVSMPEFGGSCGGGGRYDRLVGLFSGQDTPACGFSIGFERIIMLLTEQGFTVPGQGEHICYMIDKKVTPERVAEILSEAAAKRSGGAKVLTVRMNKNRKFQKEQLSKSGYTSFKEFYE